MTHAKPDILKDIWYLAGLSAEFKAGAMVRKEMFDEPVVIGRTKAGALFALRDVCPHRAAPLSNGEMIENDAAAGGATTLQCPYHGWRMRTDDGACAAIPALTDDQSFDTSKIRTPAYRLHEEHGLVWIYAPADVKRQVEPRVAPPTIEHPVGKGPHMVARSFAECRYDEAVTGLIDPAHAAFVHKAWWWRASTRTFEKTKAYEPAPQGFKMVAHPPSSNGRIYRWLIGGAMTTEILFQLPGLRIETIRNERHTIVGVTAITPLAGEKLELTQLFYWDLPLLSVLKPLLLPVAQAFLDQDGTVLDGQQMNMRHGPTMLYVDDADRLAKWYHKLKREWRAANEDDRPFENEIEPTTLRWKT
ncbi:MAG: Rieske 2Fe-2S domain-containing protein [Pseudomonadota bacterium]